MHLMKYVVAIYHIIYNNIAKYTCVNIFLGKRHCLPQNFCFHYGMLISSFYFNFVYKRTLDLNTSRFINVDLILLLVYVYLVIGSLR